MKAPIAFLLISLAALGCGKGNGSGADAITSPVDEPSLTLSPDDTTLIAGQSTTATVVLRRRPNGQVVADGNVSWTSSNPSIAVVVSSGQRSATISAVGVGWARITASIAGVSSYLFLDVTSNPAVAVSSLKAFIYSEQDGMSFIPTPSGSSGVVPTAINDLGQVVGSIEYGNGPSHAFLWSRAEGLRDLGALAIGGTTSRTSARAINQNGEVAGYGFVSRAGTNSVAHTFRWTQRDGMVDIGLPPGATSATALGINRNGEVIGSSSGQGFGIFRWSASRGMESVAPTLVGFTPTAINDAGQIALMFSDPNDPNDFDGYDYGGASVLSPSGVKTDIIVCHQCGAAPRAINGTGVVAGTDGEHAFTWTAAGGISLLTGVPQGVYSEATGINDTGTVIGIFHTSASINYVLRSFLWSSDRGYREIPLPPDQRSISVTGINNKDQIVGYVW